MSAIPLPPESVMQTPKSNNAALHPFSSIEHSGRSPKGDRLEGAGLEPQANLACLRSHEAGDCLWEDGTHKQRASQGLRMCLTHLSISGDQCQVRHTCKSQHAKVLVGLT